MEKGYVPNPGELPPGEPGQNYAAPTDEKHPQSFGEPDEMFVRPHKTLPHLKGRRVYQEAAVAAEESAPAQGTTESGAVGQVPGTMPERTEEQKIAARMSPVAAGKRMESDGGIAQQPKPKAGLDLNTVPRPTVISGENTVQGVKYSTKLQMGSPTPPPPVVSRHYALDEGNSIPRMFRCSLQFVMADNTAFLNTTMFPLGATIQPFAELNEYETPVPLSKHGGDELVRCTRCGTYANPGFAFMDGGTKIKCNMCEGYSPVPTQATIQGADGSTRPEVTVGTYDFLAPAGLAGKKVSGHNILLVIECTQNAINLGTSDIVIISCRAHPAGHRLN